MDGSDLNRKVMLHCYFPEYERSDCIGCITLVCIVFDNESPMQLRLMVVFMFVLRITPYDHSATK